jgi:hypothetical protein
MLLPAGCHLDPDRHDVEAGILKRGVGSQSALRFVQGGTHRVRGASSLLIETQIETGMGLTIDWAARTIRSVNEVSFGVGSGPADSSGVPEEGSAGSLHGAENPPQQRWTNGPRVWLLIGLSLTVYTVVSSVLGEALWILASVQHSNTRPVETFLGVWSASAIADAVFVAGSIATALAGAMVAKTYRIRSMALAALMTWLTYTIAASFLPAVQSESSSWYTAYLFAPEVGFLGLIFAAVSPAIARGHLVRILAGSRSLQVQNARLPGGGFN